MSTKLATLRSALDSLRKRRATVRLATAFSGFLAALIWILVGCFLLDWSFKMELAPRFVLILIGLYVLVRSWRRYAGPLLGQSETLLQTALLVEKTKEIDSDLIAALEFENPQAEGWGSAELQEEVKDAVAELSKSLDVSEGFSTGALGKRATAFVLSACLVGSLCVVFPGFGSAFIDRMLFGSAHYPTNTTIETVLVIRPEVKNPETGGVVFARQETDVIKAGKVRSPVGEPLVFEVRCSQKNNGKLPEGGTLSFTGTSSASKNLVAEKDKDGKLTGLYTARLSQLIGDMEFKVEAGDAYSEWFSIERIDRPVVEVELAAKAPGYVGDNAVVTENSCQLFLDDKGQPEQNLSCDPGIFQVEVQEGGEIKLALTSRKKELKKVVLKIGEENFELENSGRKSRLKRPIWVLKDPKTPLSVVKKRLKYSIEVTDADGLQPELEIAGLIQIRADKPPRVQASLVSRYVLPEAAPMIDLVARDDYDIGKVQVHVEVSRQQQQPEKVDSITVPAKLDVDPARNRFKASPACTLKKYDLKKDDIVRLIVEVTDGRGGELEGESSRSEALSLRVTDRSGLLNAITELDKNSVRQLDAIIEKELGIGDSK
ncbi:MAG: hypothetical protein VX675_07995 [Planctomycetota bacterium]|nr:hypothetical protein [Planctomycetota bacterium]